MVKKKSYTPTCSVGYLCKINMNGGNNLPILKKKTGRCMMTLLLGFISRMFFGVDINGCFANNTIVFVMFFFFFFFFFLYPATQ